jgi:hypothetical protein
MADPEDRVMKTYWPASRPWRYSLDFHRRPVANWGVSFYEGSEPISEQRWDAQPKEVTTTALRVWLEEFTGRDVARELVDAVFASRPFFFVDRPHGLRRRSSP